nr:MAG TPA: Cytochrome C' [Caudoviricetes sp.]
MVPTKYDKDTLFKANSSFQNLTSMLTFLIDRCLYCHDE